MKRKNFLRMKKIFFHVYNKFFRIKVRESHQRVMSQSWQKNNVLCHISSSMSLEKRRTLMQAFIESQFNYCPLIWMLPSKTLNNKINHIHEKALRPLYSDYNSSFYELLDEDNTFTIHQQMSKIQQLKFINTYMAYFQQYQVKILRSTKQYHMI